MEIKDSGERRTFTTGAQRDMAIGKGRFDICCLDICGDFLNKYLEEEQTIGSKETVYLLDMLFISSSVGLVININCGFSSLLHKDIILTLGVNSFNL